MVVRLAATTPVFDDALARILIAIELSKKRWIVGGQMPLKAKMSQFRLEAGDGLLKLIERLRQQVERDLGRPVEVITCYEARSTSDSGKIAAAHQTDVESLKETR
jgi:hypothetical protein